MTNVELIERTKQLKGITEEVHTFATWQEMGYKIKKGEKAIMEVEIWKPRAGRMIGIMNKEVDDNDEEIKKKGKFFLKKSHFFSETQVEKK